ncbi:uncharacterized protein LOC109537154 isoform X2 [Dendroctonus ponderosae]|uniref:uncharacterized protein LOC109537154 isoform X2 n=1 Tax=Dendroctonus ponderosae TaxID=77166 RepID=UPI00203521CD|nr:uncharacterized protein LOC109537154 isoform X2 [Dendroctonus ponderosae]
MEEGPACRKLVARCSFRWSMIQEDMADRMLPEASLWTLSTQNPVSSMFSSHDQHQNNVVLRVVHFSSSLQIVRDGNVIFANSSVQKYVF